MKKEKSISTSFLNICICIILPRTAQNQLVDLDFADELAPLSHTHEQMQIRTASVAAVSTPVGLNIHKGKTKVLKDNTGNTNPITLCDETLEEVESFTYLGSIIDEQGGSDADVKTRIGKARVAFLQLKYIWNSKQLSTNIKFRTFNTNMKTVLLYGAETWRTTTTIIKKLSTQNTSDPLARHYKQQSTMRENKRNPNGGRNQKETLEVDRTHIEESTQLCHEASLHLESSRPNQKRKTKEHTTLTNGYRHGKNEQQSDRTGKEGRGQSGLENADR
ncbi:unnamed protein product [Schistosoma curassoni]|uniref:DUF6451 domain-containing protein n=1 Tax=Schistosoma curassoni TaxID=6186 RepID=A0A183KIQ9_9TREM|nr:unnamed protein product [Schistosoma curassoni]